MIKAFQKDTSKSWPDLEDFASELNSDLKISAEWLEFFWRDCEGKFDGSNWGFIFSLLMKPVFGQTKEITWEILVAVRILFGILISVLRFFCVSIETKLLKNFYLACKTNFSVFWISIPVSLDFESSDAQTFCLKHFFFESRAGKSLPWSVLSNRGRSLSRIEKFLG